MIKTAETPKGVIIERATDIDNMEKDKILPLLAKLAKRVDTKEPLPPRYEMVG